MKELKVFIDGELKKNAFLNFLIAFFFSTSIWWLSIYFRGLTEGIENNLYTLIYPLLSLGGGVYGLIAARKWGGFKSLLGKALSMLSLGLLAQFFGQFCYAYFIYIKGIEVPYPSLGDVGYFGSIIFYTFGVIYLSRVLGVNLNLKSLKVQLTAILIPAILLNVSYFLFVYGNHVDSSEPLKTFLDFGYPLGQAFYVSLAVLTYLLSKNLLGGIMKGPVIFLIFALIVQYISDSMFLLEAGNGEWYVGGINDFMYSTSYFLMTFGLVYISGIFSHIKDSN